VVITKVYRNSKAVDYLREAGVRVDIYQEDPKWREEVLKIFNEDIPERINEGEIKFEEK